MILQAIDQHFREQGHKPHLYLGTLHLGYNKIRLLETNILVWHRTTETSGYPNDYILAHTIDLNDPNSLTKLEAALTNTTVPAP